MPTLASRRDRLSQLFRASPIMPVITIEHVDHGVPLARAMLAGGIRTLEITLRTAAAIDAARTIIEAVPEMQVGIGTVLTPRDLAEVAAIGAQYALSPGATPDLLDVAADSDLPFVPGIATASDLMAALARGFEVVKLFPAVPAGGIPALRALAGPFPTALFCPTGGINEANFGAWLAEPNVVAVGGSWLAPPADIGAGNWAVITQRARQAMSAIG